MKTPLLIALVLLCSSAALAEEPGFKMITTKTVYGDISYPQISGVADKNIENSLNKMIIDEAGTWNCDFDGQPPEPERLDYNAWTNVHLIDERFLSYTVHHDLYCGGARPNQFIEAYNYDLQQGNPIFTNGLLVPDLQAEKLTAYLLKGHQFDDETCADAYVDINWDYYRTKDEIVFMPRLSGGPTPCWEEFPVKIDTIKDYMWTELPEDRD